MLKEELESPALKKPQIISGLSCIYILTVSTSTHFRQEKNAEYCFTVT
jgi:hypothetical protein